jgi:hypothetical protein
MPDDLLGQRSAVKRQDNLARHRVGAKVGRLILGRTSRMGTDASRISSSATLPNQNRARAAAVGTHHDEIDSLPRRRRTVGATSPTSSFAVTVTAETVAMRRVRASR